MKIIVIYKSRTGFTKRYAEWIREELKCEIADYDDIKKLYINNYDLLIYGGRVHAGKIDSLENIKRLSDSCKCSLIVYATGATPIAATSEIKKNHGKQLFRS